MPASEARIISSRPSSDHGFIDGKPRCAFCGHTMSRYRYGFNCIENTCPVGLAVLGDFHAAARCAARRGEFVHSGLHP